MNWLAHLFLSKPTPECWMGSLLPDFLRNAELQTLPREFDHGIRQHRIVDSFTDSHSVVMLSRRRLPAPYRRYGGIVIDMFYDHLLASEWDRYAAEPLDEFTAKVYGALLSCSLGLSGQLCERLERMAVENWLGSYRETEGIREALRRIGARLSRPVDLGEAVVVLEVERASFAADFNEFFPQLRRHLVAVEGDAAEAKGTGRPDF